MERSESMIIDGYFLALLSIYNSRDVSSKNLANKERNNCPELENRACEPPRQAALKIKENSRGLLRVAILVSTGRNFGVFLVTSCFLH